MGLESLNLSTPQPLNHRALLLGPSKIKLAAKAQSRLPASCPRPSTIRSSAITARGAARLGGAGLFHSVQRGFLFGTLLAGQFAEIWETLGRPDDFVIVEQGAHEGEFAADVLDALHARQPKFFARRVIYRIVEPFPILRERQEERLRNLDRECNGWRTWRRCHRLSGLIFPMSCSTRCQCIFWLRPIAGASANGKSGWSTSTNRDSWSSPRPISDSRLRER